MKTRLTLKLLALLLPLSTAWAASSLPAAESLLSLPAGALQPNPQQAGQLVYRKPGIDLKTYHSLIIEPLTFIEHQPDGQWQLLQAGEANRIDRAYRDQLQQALQTAGIAVVQEPAPGVARLRVAITGFRHDKPGLAVSDFIPVKAVFNLARKAIGAEPYLLQVSTLGQLEDAQSGMLLAGSVDAIDNAGSKTLDQPITLEMLQNTITRWSQRNATQLAQQLSPTSP
jgi:hypothetical protein